jgi:hypothetical protein
MAETKPTSVSPDVGTPKHQRAIQLQPYLNRTIPNWGHPGYFAGQMWRKIVRDQPIAIICRDTLISNMLSKDWSIRLREPEPTSMDATKKEIDHYTQVIEEADGDFDTHISLIMQDLLDLPFGGMGEVGRTPDGPEGKAQWIEHVDGATCVPSGDRKWPVVQSVPELPNRPVVFPEHAANRMYMTPSPNIRRKGWGMAPPEKIYLAITMLYRGDRYYANLLLDTPEAGVLDLGDMSKETAFEWLEGFRSLFAGSIDGFKVPVIYEHEKPVQWIPFNRPPIDMLYDQTTLKYAQIVAAGYGIRLSDIGMSEVSGDKTLAGVIRGERQSRRTGQAEVASKLNNYFNNLLPKHLEFSWTETDAEVKAENAKALSTYGLAIGQLKRDGLLSPEESRLELVATGLLMTEIDPNKVPEPPTPPGLEGGGGLGGFLGKLGGGKKPPSGKPDDEKVPPEAGGRGNIAAAERAAPISPDSMDGLGDELLAIVKPAMERLPSLATLTGTRYAAKSSYIERAPYAPRLMRLIRAVTKEMIPQVAKTFKSLDQETVERIWLPQMQALEFDMPSELDSLIVRQSTEKLRELLESHLEDDKWWQTASAWDKAEILDIYKRAYALGLEDTALEIIRSLYEEGLAKSALFGPQIRFDLTNRATIQALEDAAALMVARVNDGTKYFIKRIIVAGVRDVVAQAEIAQAIRDGVAAEELLRRDGFVQPAIDNILEGMIEMSESRAMSIVNTELRRANVKGSLDEIKRTGLKTKSWRHLGTRGVTEAGNVHPCPTCGGNEALGVVPIDFLYPTVFKTGGPQDDGREEGPPGHPQVCHCTVTFDQKELFDLIKKKGEFAPYLGGR